MKITRFFSAIIILALLMPAIVLPASAAEPKSNLVQEAATCESLMDLELPGTTITLAESIVRNP